MHLTVIHDIHGNIASVAASPPDSGVLYLATKPGQHSTEVEAPELTVDQGSEYIRRHLADVIKNHLVATQSNVGRLTKKPGVATEKPSG